MLRKFLFALINLSLASGLVACGAEATGTPIVDPPPAAVAAARQLSDEYDIPMEQIEYVTYTDEEWPDACLGLPNAEEMCAQVITPGFRVVLQADGEEYVYRTDETGQIIRQEY